MKYMLLALVAILALTGCSGGGGSDNIPSEPVDDGKLHVIYDNDHFDPDWVIGLDTMLTLHRNSTVVVDAILITGTDTYRKAGLKYKSIVDYYGLDIPIGINHISPMRTTSDKASAANPTLDSRYKGGYTDISQFDSDGLFDEQREEGIDLLCRTLEAASPKSVKYISGGHLQNIRDLLKETSRCNGAELVKSKIIEIVMNGGGVGGKPEMNFSEGTYQPTSASQATMEFFSMVNVPVLLTTEFMDTAIRPGDVYLNHKIGSPMEFIIAVPTYGTYGDHGVSDNAAIMVAVHGTNIFGNEYVTRDKVCLEPTSYGALKFGSCDKEHYYMRNMNLDLVANYTIDLLRQ